MNKVKEDMILRLTDTLDEAAMLYYEASIDDSDHPAVTNYDKEKGRLHYYECLFKMIDCFLEITNLDELTIPEEIKNQIDQLFQNLEIEIENNGLNSEEVRRALLLLDIKGFKNLNYSLDLITPDNIGLIIAKFIEVLVPKKKMTILDYNFGIGNLTFTIVNHLEKEVHLLGMDNHPLMCEVASHKSNLMQVPLTMFHQDALEYLPSDIDLVVCDLAVYAYENPNYTSYLYQKGVRYFPYLAIEHYLALNSDTIYIYIIDNDFFSQEGSEKLRQFIDENGSIRAFIALPTDMFQTPEIGKALLILDNHPKQDKQVPIFMLPPVQNKQAFLNTMAEILQEIKRK